uniref:Uncharacterized protein n=1 Tax=Nicotiana tabacum TaxID=4097 RepID=A0A1S3Z7V4_TOBAC|nr:PREDICTED: uncharacterized protein LOC107783966 [Nicotiana tabacum]
MAQEMESLREEVQHIRELAHLVLITLPQPPRFPSLDSLPDHFPSTACQNNNNTPTSAPTTQFIPPITLANPPNLPSHTPYIRKYVQTPQNPHITNSATHTPPRDGVTCTTNQHKPVTYATTHERYVPPIYVIYEPTFTTPIMVKMPYEIDQYTEMEREAKRKEEESVSEQLQILRKQMKCLQVARGSESLDYEDMCIHPDVDMTIGYKPPKFDIFDRMGDPQAHLRAYCDKLVRVSRNEKLRMKLLIRSLTREALT